MSAGSFRFDRFVLDTRNRRLTCDDVPVELNGRYLDALILLVREPGRLISKDRFFDEVWRGAAVTDEALTQCIRTVRRQLGDSATSPRFIETVSKHGYRFIAPVEAEAAARTPVAQLSVAAPAGPWRAFLVQGGAGTAGAVCGGTLGGLIYGVVAASRPETGVSALSLTLVIVSLTGVVAFMGGMGVSFGIAAAHLAPRLRLVWTCLGGTLGGLVVGALVNLMGLDALGLLFGRAPEGVTGAPEGAVLGFAVGIGAGLATFVRARRWGIALAGLSGAVGGALVTACGGRLMAGSLVLFSHTFPGSRLRLDALGSLFGEPGFGVVTRIVTGGLEGALFSACVVGGLLFAGWKRRAG